MGGIWGVLEHRRTFDGTSKLLKRNHLLNCVTKRCTFVGNSLAVLVLIYSASSALIGMGREKEDLWNDVLGGGITGGFYKSTRGIKTAATFTGIGMIAGLAVNLVNGTLDHGKYYASDTLNDAVKDLWER